MRKKENPNLKDTEDMIKVLAKSTELSGDCIITTTPDGIITSWNRGAEFLYGYSAKEILGISISILDPPILVGESVELNEFIKSEDIINDYDTLRLKKDNTIITVTITLSPILDDSENIVAILIITRDITQSKILNEKLRRAQELYKIVTEQTGQIIYDYNLITVGVTQLALTTSFSPTYHI